MLRYTVLAGLAACISAFPVAPFSLVAPVSTNVTQNEDSHSRRARATVCDDVGCQWSGADVTYGFCDQMPNSTVNPCNTMITQGVSLAPCSAWSVPTFSFFADGFWGGEMVFPPPNVPPSCVALPGLTRNGAAVVHHGGFGTWSAQVVASGGGPFCFCGSC